MIYFLEGNECCFKSTVAEKLHKATGFEIIKGSSFELSQKPNDELYFYFDSILNLDDIIVDRFIYSNLVYAYLYEDYSILSDKQVKQLQNKMNKKKVCTIFLTASDEVIKGRLRIRGDDYVNEDMISSINNKYIEVIKKARKNIGSITFNTEMFTSDEIVNQLIKLR